MTYIDEEKREKKASGMRLIDEYHAKAMQNPEDVYIYMNMKAEWEARVDCEYIEPGKRKHVDSITPGAGRAR